jgi:hypothetical protein
MKKLIVGSIALTALIAGPASYRQILVTEGIRRQRLELAI